jgi:predicted phage terminase large subunit-like protein
MEAYRSLARFIVCSCGRRGGKTFFAAFKLGVEVLKNHNPEGIDLALEEVWYIAPTFDQAKGNIWHLFKQMWRDAIDKTHENTATAVMKNGRRLRLKGADRPDTLRGSGLSYVGLDEFAFMKPQVWDLIVQPMLARSEGGALFTGTPDGKNHFYDLYLQGLNQEEKWNDWASFNWGTADNPVIPEKEVVDMEKRMTKEAFLQEAMGKFTSGSSLYFKEDFLLYGDKPEISGYTYIAVDPAGYGSTDGLVASKLKRQDECAIAIVEVSEAGWFVHEIIHGRFGVREASLQIVRAAKKYRPIMVGIEKGSLKNAIMPYLHDQQKRLGIYFQIQELSHGGKKKQERIAWALQGRFEKGQIVLKNADWNRHFVEQLLDFPNPMAHDDLIDALAYIDQLASTNYFHGDIEEDIDYQDSLMVS